MTKSHLHRGEARNNIDTIFLFRKEEHDTDVNDDLSESSTAQTIIESATEDMIEKIAPTLKRAPKFSRWLVAMVVVFIFSVMPIKILDTQAALQERSQKVVSDLNDLYPAFQNGDYETLRQSLDSIQKNISEIQNGLRDLGQKSSFISSLPAFQDELTNNENILDAAESISNIAARLLDDLEFLQTVKINAINSSQDNKEFFVKVKSLAKDLDSLQKDFDTLSSKISNIKTTGLNDQEYRYAVLLKSRNDDIHSYYQMARGLVSELPRILGESYDQKYLVLFENDTELRPTGGFIGTYGVITIRDAKVKSIKIDSIYNPDGQLSSSILPPEPLQKITDSFGMRDANWDPDFPTTAQLISRFYEKEGGFTPDGIIAIDTKPFLDLLDITGPIILENHDLSIDEDNFIKTTQYKTSIDYDPSLGNPKQFLQDFAPLFLDKVLSAENKDQSKIFNIILKNISEKHIQFFSNNQKLEEVLGSLGIAGEIKNTNSDYFMYVDANIGGLKTNGDITESLTHQIVVQGDGSIDRATTLKRIHSGTYDWPGGTNYAYLRFYLPKGSKINSVSGLLNKNDIAKDPSTGVLQVNDSAREASLSDLDIYQEHDKTVVGGWQKIAPGEETAVTLSYRLPFKYSSAYSLLIQKQAGISKQATEINTVNIPDTSKNYHALFDLEKEAVIAGK